MTEILDNIVWHSLSGEHARFATGTVDARRYAPGFSPILGFANSQCPNFDALSPYCETGEHFYCRGWEGSVHDGWHVDLESTMFTMVWEGGRPAEDGAPDAVRLGAEHAEQALELALLTNPGPFGLRTIELGEYWGYFDGGRLIAMAGERFFAGSFREISGVCTHPDYQGRGYARQLMTKLIHREMARNELPFLHVMRDNTGPHALYRRMGFIDYREVAVRIVSRI